MKQVEKHYCTKQDKYLTNADQEHINSQISIRMLKTGENTKQIGFTREYFFSVPWFLNLDAKVATALQSMMNAKLSKQRFWHCYENGLIKTIQTIPHNLYVIVKLTFPYWGLG